MTSALRFATLLLVAAAPIALQPAAAQTAAQQNSKPATIVPIVDTVPAPRDIPYPGTMTLEVDVTDVERQIFRVKQTIPVAQAGEMVLLYPEWLPGKHAPRGPIKDFAGLTVTAGGKTIPWVRDHLDMYAFHIDVPEGAKQIVVEFQYLSPTQPNQGRVVVTEDMMNIQWEAVSMYPAGYYTRQIPVRAIVEYPKGWTARSGLPANNTGSTYSYQVTSYETLIDSPVFAGKHFREFELSDQVDLNIFADSPEELNPNEAQLAAHRKLIDQAVKLFGAQHYDQYEFLLAITDEMGGIGLEHHRSSENSVDPGYFTDWEGAVGDRNLLPHELVHSWNGKYRRGANLWTPDYRTPMRDTLLWVYEGQTQFWGYILGARSGMFSKQETLDAIALIYAGLDARPGRRWRPMIDTTHDPIIAERRPKGWTSWQRSEDYYNEGLLIWLEADAILRRESGGTKSMDDFARAFFGMNDGDWGVLTYTREDVIETLNAIQPYDWAEFLAARLDRTTESAPIGGITGNGYRLVYTEEPTDYIKTLESGRDIAELTYSVGLSVGSDGGINSVRWDSPAYDAKLSVGDEIVAVNGQAYSNARIKDAVTAAKTSGEPIRLTAKVDGEHYREFAIDYDGGLRYPRLEKTVSGEAGLDRLLSAK